MAFDVKLCNSGASFNVNIGKVYVKKLKPPRKNLFSINQATCCEDGTTEGFGDFKGSTISASTAESHQGSYSLKVITPGNVIDEGVALDFPFARVIPSQTYTFSAWLKGSGEVYLWIAEIDEETYLRDSHSSAITLTGTWVREDLTIAIEADCTQIQTYIDTTYAQAATYYIDEMQLELGSSATTWEIPSTTSISLTKPSTFFKFLTPRKNLFNVNQATCCEGGTTTGFDSYQGATISASTDEHYQGSYSLKIVTPNSTIDEGAMTNFTPAIPGKTYTLSMWVKGTGTWYLDLAEYGSWSWIRDNLSSVITATSTWTKYSVSATVGMDCYNIVWFFTVDVMQSATCYVDALQLERGTPTTITIDATHDGYAYMADNLTWDDLREGAGVFGDNDQDAYTTLIETRLVTDRYWKSDRNITTFDGSSIPDNAIILSAVVSLWGEWHGAGLGNPGISIIDASPANPLFIAGDGSDYDGTTYTRVGNDITYANWLESWRDSCPWNNFTLNAAGISQINKTGYFSFMFLSTPHVDDTEPSWEASKYARLQWEGLNVGTHKPHISITYSLPWEEPTSTTLASLIATFIAGGINQNISASVGFTVSLIKSLSLGRTMSASIAFSVSLLKSLLLNRIMSVNATFTSSITKVATRLRTISANATFDASLSRFVTAYRSISASLAFAVSIVSQKTKSQTISASLAFTASIGLLKSKSVALSASLASTVTLVRGLSLGRSLSVTENATASLSRLLNIYRELSVIENASVSLSRSLSMLRTLSVTEQPVPTLSRLSQLKRTISAVVSFVASLLSSKVAPYPPDLLPTIYLICDTNNGASLSCDTTPSVSLECDATTKTIYLICRET
jgi:hypothetical protein